MDDTATVVWSDERNLSWCQSIDATWFFHGITESMVGRLDDFMANCLSSGVDFLARGETINPSDGGNATALILVGEEGLSHAWHSAYY